MAKKEIADFIFETIKEKLDLQMDSIDNVTTKALHLLGFVGLLFGLIIQSTTIIYSNYYFIPLGLLLIASLLLGISIFQSKYWRDPDPKEFNKSKTYDFKLSRLKQALTANFVANYERNDSLIKNNWMFIYIASFLIFLTILSIGGIVIFNV
jgi:hypothetical protein